MIKLYIIKSLFQKQFVKKKSQKSWLSIFAKLMILQIFGFKKFLFR